VSPSKPAPGGWKSRGFLPSKTGHLTNKNAGRIGFNGDLMMILWGFSEDLMGV
jgi:hypothetical protein